MLDRCGSGILLGFSFEKILRRITISRGGYVVCPEGKKILFTENIYFLFKIRYLKSWGSAGTMSNLRSLHLKMKWKFKKTEREKSTPQGGGNK